MTLVRDGDIEKLGILFQRYRTMLLNFFIRSTRNHEASEDLVQDVFVRILKYRHTFGQGSEFAAWMYQIARNAHFLQRRKLGREVLLPRDEDFQEIASEDPGPDELAERRQEFALLHEAIQLMPAEKRELLLLSRIQKLKYSQIAERLRCEVGTVKVRVFRATREVEQRVRKLLKENRRCCSLRVAGETGILRETRSQLPDG